ncbi:hypothetical protein ATCC90586_006104 [Pythium insidiosum]|nr:hypothetical protein ATCC90586_006104 [Pythium insidiosum]
MLRELVSKQRGDPRAVKALDDAIATVMLGKEKAAGFLAMTAPGATTAASLTAAWGDDRATSKGDSAAADIGASSALTLRREKDKWEQRARETAAECQRLHEQVLVLQQQLDDLRGADGELWFSSVQAGGLERQRITDSVYRSRCSWEDVGDAIVELLNNETIWGAVQGSAFRDKGGRASRGLEALLHRMDSMSLLSDAAGEDHAEVLKQLEEETTGAHDKRTLTRRRSAMSQAGRLVACRTCNGCGYLDASATTTNQSDEPSASEDDSYLRKTLAQVLELKAALEEANVRHSRLEQELQRTVLDGAKAKEQLERIEFIRSHGVDVSQQVDLDGEEEVDLEAIMTAYADPSAPSQGRTGARWKQYEHLIVELKNSLSERDAGLAELRAALADAQSRLVSVQRDSQKAQETHQHAVLALKTSLVLAMKTRNDVIEERQAAVKLLMKNAERKNSALVPARQSSEDEDAKQEAQRSGDVGPSGDSIDVIADVDELDEVKRSEVVARRYSEAVSRVHQEFEEQQALLKQMDDELGQDIDKRKRTNSITMGSIVVSMTSHPRDLFKALATAHTDLTNLRRSSQRAAALQTDRLLTLTTHLAHISEELCMVRKRTSAELEYWKLECEKMQNNGKMLTTDLQRTQQLLQEARERSALAVAPGQTALVGGCTLCAKHQARLLEISNSMLESGPSGAGGERHAGTSDVSSRPSAISDSDEPATAKPSGLSDSERASLGAILLELESLYTTFTSSKQQNAREFITRALVGPSADVVASSSAGFRPSRSPSVLPPAAHRTDKPATGGAAAHVSSTIRAGSLDVIEEEHGLDPNTVLDGRSDRDPMPAHQSHPTGGERLFQHLFANPSSEGSASMEALVLHGASITPSQVSTPSHHRKKIVRKILTEQEALRRQRARMMQMMEEQGDAMQRLASSEVPGESDVIDAADQDSVLQDLIPYSTFIDEYGRQIYYIDEEVEDSDDESVAYSIQIPTPAHPADEESSREQAEPKWSPLSQSPRRHFALLGGSDDISKDPEVITQLRDLVQHNTTSRELLALTNWKILICHLRAQRDQRRLVFMNELLRTNGGKPAFVSGLLCSIRGTMQKLVQFREMTLHSASQLQDDVRKQSHRAQAHQRGIRFAPAGDGEHVSMMHSVSQILPSQGSTPSHSPPKSSLTLDSRRRPPKSAGPLRRTDAASDHSRHHLYQ